MDKLSANNWIVIGAGALVLLLGAWWLMANPASPSEGKTENTEQEETGSTSTVDVSSVVSTTSDGESISVVDQPAGDRVAVSNVEFTQSGWIAVRDDRGWTLGASRFGAGTHEDVVVKLLRATTPGQRYQVLLYIDDGDGAFDLETEILVIRSDGSVAGTTFSAQ